MSGLYTLVLNYFSFVQLYQNIARFKANTDIERCGQRANRAVSGDSPRGLRTVRT